MHPEVMSAEPGTCPQCGMKLIPAAASLPASRDQGARPHDMATASSGRT